MPRETARLRFIEPQLPSLVDQPPESKHWLTPVLPSSLLLAMNGIERLNTCWAAFKSSRLTDAKWCQPELAVRVRHLAGSTLLRHATVRALER